MQIIPQQTTFLDNKRGKKEVELNKFYSSMSDKYLTSIDYSLRDKVNFQNHQQLPVHRWLKYREGYSVELIKKIAGELNIKGPILDPFLGSGTTTFAASLLKIKSFGIEINPFPAFVARVKTRKYTESFINRFRGKLSTLTKENKPAKKPKLSIVDKTFNEDVLNDLLEIKTNIEELENSEERDLAFFTWLSILESASNTFKEGNGIKYKGKFGYKRPPRKDSAGYKEYQEKIKNCKGNEGWPSKNVRRLLTKRFNEIMTDIESINYQNWRVPIIILGDARNATKHITEAAENFNGIELSVFSPPYANCFDYYEIFKIELWMGGFVKSYEDLKNQRQNGLVSNLNVNLENINFKNEHLDFLTSQVNREDLWDKRVIDMLRGYFRDMHIVLKQLYELTKKNGYVVIVVANSAYGDVIFPTDLLLTQIGEQIGFKTIQIVQARVTNTSSQQMKRLKEKNINTSLLRESLVYLQKG